MKPECTIRELMLHVFVPLFVYIVPMFADIVPMLIIITPNDVFIENNCKMYAYSHNIVFAEDVNVKEFTEY